MKYRTPALFLAPAAMVLCAAAVSQPPAHKAAPHAAAAPDATFQHTVLPVITKYCVGCHGGASPAAGIDLTSFKTSTSVVTAHDTWVKVSRNVITGHMPPAGSPHPTDAQRKQVSTWINAVLAPPACNLHDPGRVTLRRLNREEYNNTVRDLLGVDFKPAADFPNDDVGYGFDDIGDVLTVSPLLMEKYLAAAEKIARDVMDHPDLKARLIPSEPTAQNRFQISRQILTSFAARAYRRPATPVDVDRLMRFAYLAAKEGDSFDKGIQLAVEAALISPDFLYRVELDSNPTN
ncbi:MAG TPA: DUF1587 domain-containing protein, partial [Chthonomonadales bacterium]|nr:DUF1587 domain-containing protein [Chthonomonadales bacterium]